MPRPTLPIGHSIVGLPPVVAALRVEQRLELYAIKSKESDEHELLLLVRKVSTTTSFPTLRVWLESQPSDLLTGFKELDGGDIPGGFVGVHLKLRCRSIEDAHLSDKNEEELKRFFLAIVDLIERSIPLKCLPDLGPSLAWVSSDDTSICSLLPLEDSLPPETEMVRIAATAFFRLSTGIMPDVAKGEDQSLLSWAKYAGEGLARTTERSISPKSPKEAITTLHALKIALGRDSVEVAGSKEHQAVAASMSGHGLDKVAGMSALKDLLRREVVMPIREPGPYLRYGLSIPNGILLYGPPGCGKTYIARQLAEELGHYFVEIIPSELASPYIHQSVIRIRELFDDAAEHAPAVVFIDEFEALVPARGGLGGHQQYKAEEVTEFLVHLNSCAKRNIFIIAATNQPEKIDPAVRRTGRLDKLIYVGPPDSVARREMLSLHLAGRPIAQGFDLDALANELHCYSASDISFLVDEASRVALKEKTEINTESFKSAMSRVQGSVTPQIEAMHNTIVQRGSS